MILAIATLLFQIPTIPQTVISPASTMVSATGSTSSQATPAATSQETASLTSPGAASPAPASQELLTSDIYSSEVAFIPGRTTLEVVPLAASDPANAVFAPPLDPGTPALIETVEHAAIRAREEQRRRHEWFVLSLAQHSAAILDAWSTRRAISSGQAWEVNPFLRPFAGNGSIYAAIQVGPFVLDYVSRRMMHSEHAWIRHTWWVPQVLCTASSLASGINNLQFHN